MNHTHYYYGRLFLGLGLAVGMLQSIVYLMVGARLYGLSSFLTWLAVSGLIALAGSFFILKYYHHKKFWIPLSMAILVVISDMFLNVTVATVLLTRTWFSLYMSTALFSQAVGIIYGLCLIFTRSGKYFWLRTAGIVTAITGILTGAGLIWAFQTPFEINKMAISIDQWTSVVRSLIPLLFMMHFSAEEKILTTKIDSLTASKSQESTFSGVALIGFLFTIGFGIMIMKDGIASVVWSKRNAARAEALAAKSERRLFVASNGDTLRYLLMKPVDYDPEKTYPIVVCLPYGGYESPPADLLSRDDLRKKYPAFLFIPYSPHWSSWGGVPVLPPKDFAVYECLSQLNDSGIDPKRRYVLGVSKGGYGSWHFICERPEMFAAAIPVCGGGDPTKAEKVVDVAVWAFHGALDDRAPVSGSRDMIEAIRNVGGHPKYTEFGHLGHDIWKDVSTTPGLLNWLFAQTKE